MKIFGIILLLLATSYLSINWYTCYIKDSCQVKYKGANLLKPIEVRNTIKSEVETKSQGRFVASVSKSNLEVKKEEAERPKAVKKVIEQKVVPQKKKDKYKIVRGRIHFSLGARDIANSSTVNSHLESVYNKWLKNKKRKILIIGHTDNQGSERSNFLLGLKRAKKVRSLLIAKGIQPAKIKAISHGESKPIGKNHTNGGRFYNRRVEIKFR